jgi:glycerol-3-phosphate dehydrogenase
MPKQPTIADDDRKVHGVNGAFVGGEWVPIEDCAAKFNISGGSGASDGRPCPRSRTKHTSSKSDGTYDVCIVGGGCVGAAIARELSKTLASVVLLEAGDDVSSGATKGNSGIVHAGYDDTPGSVRAKFCWPGNQMFPQLDRELHFGYQKNGSMVLARTPEDEKTLKSLLERGKSNGVKNLRIIGKEEVKALEPSVSDSVTQALYSPDAGIVIPYEYTIALAENAADNGVEVRIRRQVTSMTPPSSEGGLFTVVAKHWEPDNATGRRALHSSVEGSLVGLFLLAVMGALPGLAWVWLQQSSPAVTQGVLDKCAELTASFSTSTGVELDSQMLPWAVSGFFGVLLAALALLLVSDVGLTRNSFVPSMGTTLSGMAEEERIRCRFVVNCAGCKADEVANMVGDTSFKVKPRLGEYLLLHKRQGKFAKHTLFPAPGPMGKGVLVQSTLWGNLILGPTARDTLRKDEATGLYVENEETRDESPDSIAKYILTKCKELVPGFDAGSVIHTFSGARAKTDVGDWIIRPSSVCPQLIHAAGIDSPGLAASPAIAIEVVRLLAAAGASVGEKNPSFNPLRAPLVRPKPFGSPKYKVAPWSERSKDPEENIICKCEFVSEAEVIDACTRSLPVDSTQSIRRRTRAGMGSCQANPEKYNCEMRVAHVMAETLGVPVEDIGRRPFPASSLLPSQWIDEDTRDKFRELAYEEE